jgi:hypothetical protein
VQLIRERRGVSLAFANHGACVFYGQFTATAGARAYNARMNWLVGNFEVFGLPGQNWMLVVAGVVAAYVAMLAIARRGQRVH